MHYCHNITLTLQNGQLAPVFSFKAYRRKNGFREPQQTKYKSPYQKQHFGYFSLKLANRLYFDILNRVQ